MYQQITNEFDEEMQGMLDKAMPNRLDKQISTLLSRLQAPWVCDRTDNQMMGYLYKRQRKAPHRWVLYRVILNGNNMYYFADATVCFLWFDHSLKLLNFIFHSQVCSTY